VVGVGNSLKADDGVGSYIAVQGRKRHPDFFLDAGMVLENYIFKIIQNEKRDVLLVDAAGWGAEPGSMKILAFSDLAEQGISTHSLSLRRLGEMLHDFGKKVRVLGIEPAELGLKEGLTEKVKASADEILAVLFSALEKAGA